MANLYRALTKILRENGFVLKRRAKDDHELWWNPNTGVHTLVDANSKIDRDRELGPKESWIAKSFLNAGGGG